MSTMNPTADTSDPECGKHQQTEDDRGVLDGVVGNHPAAGTDELRDLEAPIDEAPKQFYVLTHPRSASNLLVHILNLEEQHHVVTGGHGGGGYYFEPLLKTMDKLNIWGRIIDSWTPEEHTKIRTAAEDCYKDLVKDIAKVDSEPGKTSMFVKEHCDFLWSPFEHTKSSYLSSWSPVQEIEKPFPPCGDDEKAGPWILGGGGKTEGNGTLLSDDFLLKWMPTFLVRHPALAFPSNFRAARDIGWSGHENAEDDEQLAMQCSFDSSRKLYDLFDAKLPVKLKQYGGVDWPVVLTGDVVMTEPETIKRYASLVRLDTDKLRFKWDPRPKDVVESMSKNNARMLSTLIASTGIDNSKTSIAVDIDAEAVKWRKEFGDHAANALEGWVRAAMPDYEFFEARRLRDEPAIVDGRRV